MESNLTDIVNRLNGAIDMMNVEVPEGMPIGPPIMEDVAAIDGGSSTIWTNGIISIGVVRYGHVAYTPAFKIKDLSIKSEFVMTEGGTPSLDIERHRREVSVIRDASESGGLVLVDGALSRIPDIGLEKEVGAVIDTTTVVGVSKRSVLSTINGRVPDMWLPLGACEYREVPEDKLNKMVEERNLIEGARTVYARFHENGPCLRMDIAGDVGRALAISRHYSFYNICPGYPFPLAEIHRLVCMDDKRGIYENMLRAEMEKGGMGAVYLKGRIVNERETGSFHSTLDGLV